MRVGGYLYLYANKWLKVEPDDDGFNTILLESQLPWLVRHKVRFLRGGEEKVKTEYFMEHVYTVAMRQYVIDTARAFTSSVELQEDCCQEAWLAVSKAGEGKTDSYYRVVAYNAMSRLRMKEQSRYKREDKIKTIMKERILAGLPKYGRKKVRIFKKLGKKVV